MGLNSEPLPENEALLRLIDAGIQIGRAHV